MKPDEILAKAAANFGLTKPELERQILGFVAAMFEKDDPTRCDSVGAYLHECVTSSDAFRHQAEHVLASADSVMAASEVLNRLLIKAVSELKNHAP